MNPNQATLEGERQSSLESIAAPEPVIDGITQVLVSSSTNSRTSFHKQDPHSPGSPLCGQTLRASHTEWRQKPKAAMQRAVEPCPECYPGGDTE